MSSNDATATSTVSDHVFVGFNSKVAALHRETGEVVWQWKSPKGRGPVALMLDGDRVIASIYGYTYAIDAATGEQQQRGKSALRHCHHPHTHENLSID